MWTRHLQKVCLGLHILLMSISQFLYHIFQLLVFLGSLSNTLLLLTRYCSNEVDSALVSFVGSSSRLTRKCIIDISWSFFMEAYAPTFFCILIYLFVPFVESRIVRSTSVRLPKKELRALCSARLCRLFRRSQERCHFPISCTLRQN